MRNLNANENVESYLNGVKNQTLISFIFTVSMIILWTFSIQSVNSLFYGINCMKKRKYFEYKTKQKNANNRLHSLVLIFFYKNDIKLWTITFRQRAEI